MQIEKRESLRERKAAYKAARKQMVGKSGVPPANVGVSPSRRTTTSRRPWALPAAADRDIDDRVVISRSVGGFRKEDLLAREGLDL